MQARGSQDLTAHVEDITKCPICLEDFRDPKFLPCLHTFCFHCLTETFKSHRPGEEAPCPMCREKCTIPLGGVRGFRHNFIVEGLINSKRTSSRSSVCSDVSLQIDANIHAVSSFIDDLRLKAEELETARKTFLAEARKSATRVKKSGDDVKEIIDQQVKKLLDGIKLSKDEMLAESRTKKKEIDDALEEMERFRIQALEAKSGAQAASDFALVGELHEMAVKLQEVYLKAGDIDKRRIAFKPPNIYETLTAGFDAKKFAGESDWSTRRVSVDERVFSDAEKVIALYDYRQRNADDLDFSRGDVIKVVSKINGNWWTGEVNGMTGMFPTNVVVELSRLRAASVSEENPAIALYNYIRQNEYELQFLKGDVIYVIGEFNGDWWIGALGGKTGLVQANHVVLLSFFASAVTYGHTHNKAVVTRAYAAENQYELELNVGNVIGAITRLNDDWSIGELQGGIVGLFLNDHVEAK